MLKIGNGMNRKNLLLNRMLTQWDYVALLTAILFFMGSCFNFGLGFGKELSVDSNFPDETGIIADSPSPSIGNVELETPEPTVSPFVMLKGSLTKQIETLTGKVSYYIKDLKTGEEMSYQNGQMIAASLIKLFVAAEVYRQLENGTLKRTNKITSDLKSMISQSDNLATNRLAKLVGRTQITNNAKKNLGCPFTTQKNYIQTSQTVKMPTGNFTSVVDCGKVLDKLYHRDLVNSDLDQEYLRYLMQQEKRWKIPKYLPSNIKIANKTGETSSAENDAAIIYGERTDYIFVVMVNDFKSGTNTKVQETIAKMSRLVYQILNETYVN